MKDLIEIKKSEGGKDVVSARELYNFLGYDSSNWKRWYTKNIISDDLFIEKEDYVGFVTMTNGNKTMDFALTLNMAKEISMMANTVKGKKARRYFIDCENKLKEISLTPNFDNAIEMAEVWIADQKEKKEQALQIEASKEKVEFHDRIEKTNDTILVREFAKLISKEGIDLGERKLYNWFVDNKYLIKRKDGGYEPYQKYMKYFETTEFSYENKNKESKIRKSVRITGKGQIYFTKKLQTLKK